MRVYDAGDNTFHYRNLADEERREGKKARPGDAGSGENVEEAFPEGGITTKELSYEQLFDIAVGLTRGVPVCGPVFFCRKCFFSD
jgi:hypothetical protein